MAYGGLCVVSGEIVAPQLASNDGNLFEHGDEFVKALADVGGFQ